MSVTRPATAGGGGGGENEAGAVILFEVDKFRRAMWNRFFESVPRAIGYLAIYTA